MKKEKDEIRENVEETRTKEKRKRFKLVVENKNKITQTKKLCIFQSCFQMRKNIDYEKNTYTR